MIKKNFFEGMHRIVGSKIVKTALVIVLSVSAFFAGSFADAVIAGTSNGVSVKSSGRIEYKDPETGEVLVIDAIDNENLAGAINDMKSSVEDSNTQIEALTSNLSNAENYKLKLLQKASNSKYGVSFKLIAQDDGTTKVEVTSSDSGVGSIDSVGYANLLEAVSNLNMGSVNNAISLAMNSIESRGFHDGVAASDPFSQSFSDFVVDPNGGKVDGKTEHSPVGYWADTNDTKNCDIRTYVASKGFKTADNTKNFSLNVSGDHRAEGGKLYDFESWDVVPEEPVDDTDSSSDVAEVGKSTIKEGNVSKSEAGMTKLHMNANWVEHKYDIYIDTDGDKAMTPTDLHMKAYENDKIDLSQYLNTFSSFKLDETRATNTKPGSINNNEFTCGNCDAFIYPNFIYKVTVKGRDNTLGIDYPDENVRTGSEGDKILLERPVIPSNLKDKYRFAGWEVKEGAAKVVTNDYMIIDAQDVTLQAVYHPINGVPDPPTPNDPKVKPATLKDGTIYMYYSDGSASLGDQWIGMYYLDPNGIVSDVKAFYPVGIKDAKNFGWSVVRSGGKFEACLSTASYKKGTTKASAEAIASWCNSLVNTNANLKNSDVCISPLDTANLTGQFSGLLVSCNTENDTKYRDRKAGWTSADIGKVHGFDYTVTAYCKNRGETSDDYAVVNVAGEDIALGCSGSTKTGNAKTVRVAKARNAWAYQVHVVN